MDKTRITIATYNKAALDYENRYMDFDLYDDTFDIFCKMVSSKNPEILEVACGPGNVTKRLLARRPDFRITGIDLAPNMVRLAKINNPKADFRVMDCKNIGTLDQQYDAVICGFGLPYLSKVKVSKFLLDAAKILVQKGHLYISMMEDDYDRSGYEFTSFAREEKVFIYYHQFEFLSAEIIKNGFKMKEIIRKKYREDDGTLTTDLILMAEKVMNGGKIEEDLTDNN